MLRGKNQVLFKYLPGKPIDYNQGNAIALVKEWFGEKIDNINKTRIIKEVYKAMRSFESKRGYPNLSLFKPNSFELLSPVFINAELFPLTFICDSCGRSYWFNSIRQLNKTLRRQKCSCGGNLIQFDLIYFHECGHIWEPKPVKCKEHGYEKIILNKHGSNSPKEWRWHCGVCGKETANLNNWCPACKTGSQVYPRPFRQTSAFTPHSLTLVNLQNIDEDRLYGDEVYKKLVIAKYLGLFDKYGSTFEECLEISPKEDVKLEGLIKDLKEKGMKDEDINSVLESMQRISPNKKGLRNKILLDVDKNINPFHGDISETALKSYEFMETLNNSSSISLNKIVRNLMESDHPLKEKVSKFPEKIKKIGVKDAYVLNDLSIVKLVYGYTRGSPPQNKNEEERTLNKFPSDKSTDESKIPIYINNSNTEAILLELDRWKILRWLQINGLVKDIPDKEDEASLKAWFLNNINEEEINPFKEIDEKQAITKAVYKLLHSISHSLILTGSVECGLDKNSLAELIMPSIPSIIIYSNNAQNFQTGGMFTLFENNISSWVDKTLSKVERCIYDPVCMNHKSACHACIHLSEISCTHFNYDVGRDVLAGKDKEIIGFWSKKFIENVS